MGSHIIGTVNEIPPGQRKIVDVEGRSIGVFNIDGDFYALRNICPHKGAPICVGKVSGTTLPSEPGEFNYGQYGEILRCPWHGWEFNIKSGQSIFDPFKCYVKTYEVDVELDEPSEPALETYPVEVNAGKLIIYI